MTRHMMRVAHDLEKLVTDLARAEAIAGDYSYNAEASGWAGGGTPYPRWQ